MMCLSWVEVGLEVGRMGCLEEGQRRTTLELKGGREGGGEELGEWWEGQGEFVLFCG